MASPSQNLAANGKKPARRPGRPPKLSEAEQERLQEEADAQADVEENARILAEESAEEGSESDEEANDSTAEIEALADESDHRDSLHVPPPPSEESQAFDIFVDVGAYWMSKGALVSYTIFQGPAQIAKKLHPYSWEQLQDEFGPGFYKVQARDARKGTYLKQDQRMIGEVPEAPKAPELPPNPLREYIAKQAGIAPQAAAQPGLGITDILTIMERAEIKAKASADSNMQMMLQMMDKLRPVQGAVPAAPAASLGLNDPFVVMLRDQNARLEKQVERLMDKLEDAQKKDKGAGERFSALDMMKMQQEAEDKALDKWEKLEEMAEKKAEQKLEARGENGGGDGEEESLMKTVVKAMVPVLGAAYQQTQQHPQASQARPAQRPRALPQPALPPGQVRSASQNPHQPRRQVPVVSTVVLSNNGLSNLKPQSGAPSPVNSLDEKIFAVAGPMIAQMLPGGTSAESAAVEILDTLRGEGITAQNVIQVFPLKKFMDTAKNKGVPMIANPWLRRFHAEVERLSSVRPKPTLAAVSEVERPNEAAATEAPLLQTDSPALKGEKPDEGEALPAEVENSQPPTETS